MTPRVEETDFEATLREAGYETQVQEPLPPFQGETPSMPLGTEPTIKTPPPNCPTCGGFMGSPGHFHP